MDGRPVVQEHQLVMNNEVGLHARPAALFVKTASRFANTKIEVMKDGKAVNAKSILEVLTLGVSKGTTITLRAEGEGADEALRTLVALVESNFNE